MKTTAKLAKGSQPSPRPKRETIAEFKKIVETKWNEGVPELFPELEQEDIRLLNVEIGKRYQLYFHCRPDTSLKRFVELMSSGQLDVILQSRINDLLKTKTMTVKSTCKAEDYERCKRYYPRRASKSIQIVYTTHKFTHK